MSAFFFLLVSLAVWRITHLLNKEDGPFDIIYRIRKLAGAGFFGSLLDCFYCLSIWVALPFTIWLSNTVTIFFIHWLAISGAACLLEQATDRSKNEIKKPEYFED